jgi:hypothetical protein
MVYRPLQALAKLINYQTTNYLPLSQLSDFIYLVNYWPSYSVSQVTYIK